MHATSTDSLIIYKKQQTNSSLTTKNLIESEIRRKKYWWVMTESNRRHSACKADALPTELITRKRENSKYEIGAADGARTGDPRRDMPVAQPT